MSELKAGIVGCGRMGRERARCVSALGSRVAAVFDVDSSRAQELARSCAAVALASADQLFTAALDALFICTAPGARCGMEARCVEHRLPFLVEKPVGTSLAACRATLDLIEANPLIHAVGYMNRYRKSVQTARAILRPANVIGMSGHWVCRRYQVPWWEDERLSGGPFNEQATHLVDLSRFLLGEISEVQAVFSGNGQAAAALRFASGAPGALFYSCDGKEKDIGLRVFTREGSLALSGWDFQLTENSVTGELVVEKGEDVFLKETAAFLEAVRSRSPGFIESGFADAARTQQVMDEARISNGYEL